jgi:nitrous oxidase accessory protein NosD
MNDLPRQKLRELVARHGRSLVGDRRRCEGLLRDYCGRHRREVSVLVSALEEHAPHDLLAAPAGTPRGVLLARLARRLSDNLALSAGAAEWSVNSWALALGVITDEELEALERPTDATAKADAAPPARVTPDKAPPAEPVGAGRAAAAAGAPAPVANAPASDANAPATIIVSAAGGGDYASLAEAVERAAPGARVLVRPGVYDEGFVIDKPVEVVGDGPRDEIIVGSAASSCVLMRADRARVAGLTLRGRAGSAGFFAVHITRGRLLLEDCDVSSETLSCVAVRGASTAPLIRRCQIHGGADSGLYFFDGAKGAVEDCEIFGNANVGIAITGGADPVVRRGRIHGGANAGVVAWDGGLGLLEECDIHDNRLAGVGVSAGGKMTARGCRIYGGDNSGVFVHQRGDATLEDCDIRGHREAEVAVETEAQLTALRCRVREGRSAGVFVRSGGQALLQECAVGGNAGAGVSVGEGSLAAVLGCEVRGNGRAGVEVAAGGAARVSGCDLSGNRLGPWSAEEGAFVEGGGNREE